LTAICAGRLIGGGVGFDAAAFRAAAAADTIAAVFDGFATGSGGGAAAFATTGAGALTGGNVAAIAGGVHGVMPTDRVALVVSGAERTDRGICAASGAVQSQDERIPHGSES
jgi:hypothetical protein